MKYTLWVHGIPHELSRPLTRWERVRAFLAGYVYAISPLNDKGPGQT